MALVLLATSFGAGAADPQSRALPDRYLAEPDEAGNVFAQARRFDRFDYRTSLRLALADRAGLAAFLRYSGRTSLIGEGAEDHAEILVTLLDLWGDEAFARALASGSPRAVSTTQHFLEYGGATGRQFPQTFAVPGAPMTP